MFSELDLFYMLLIGILIGMYIGYSIKNKRKEKNNSNYETIVEKAAERIYVANNLLLKISLWKMIIGFAPKDEKGCYYADGSGFLSDAFCRLGIENNTIDEQEALWKIERLDKKLGELNG